MRRRLIAYALILAAMTAFPIGCSQSTPPSSEPGKPAEKQTIKIEVPNKKGGGTKTLARPVPNL